MSAVLFRLRVLYFTRGLLTVHAYVLGGGAALSSQKNGWVLRLAQYDSGHEVWPSGH